MTPQDKHLNVFYAYRGQQADGAGDRDEAQLENNVTRALLITLQGLPGFAQKNVLQQWIDSQLPWRDDAGSNGQLEFMLQEGVKSVKPKLAGCDRVWLLGISGTGEIEERGGHSAKSAVPDAWIFGEGWAIAIEVKTGGAKLSKRQLDNYQQAIKRNASAAQVPLLCKSWRRDIAPTLSDLALDQRAFPVGHFLLEQLKGYLEMEGLGTTSITRQDFIDWDQRTEALWGKIETLGEILGEELGDHRSHRQNEQPNYIGINLLHKDFQEKLNYKVPHWSLAVDRDERMLRLFVQCEGTDLSRRLIAERDILADPLAQALQPLKGVPHFQLRVEEKWFVMRSGKNKLAPLYPGYLVASLGNCRDEESIQSIVQMALGAVKTINGSRRRIKDVSCLENYTGRTLIGMLQLDFSLNWFELEDLGTKVENLLREAATKMKPYYEVLRPYGSL